MKNNNLVTAEDLILIQSEIDYIGTLIMNLDSSDLTQAREIIALNERSEHLQDLLRQFRAKYRRQGFAVIKGGLH